MFEYCEHDLSTILKNIKQPFTESEAKTITSQLLSALAHLHANWMVHRDIKPSNVLYNHRGEVKLADFGLCRAFPYPEPNNLTPGVVTLHYRPPEILLGMLSYDYKIDIWSVGCLLGELLLSQNRPLIAGRLVCLKF